MTSPSDDAPQRSTDVGVGYALDHALAMAAEGFKVVPIRPGAKYPIITQWQEKATNDEATIRKWFAKTRNGLGWAMGRQPNGTNLITIDVDSHGIDGTQALTKLIAQNNPRSAAAFTHTANAITGGGGAHFIFDVPTTIEIRNTQRLAPGIDVRGEGGQIVVAPTLHPDTGEPYRWNRTPWVVPILSCPPWLLEMMTTPEPEPEPEPEPKGASISLGQLSGPTFTDDTSPADWVAENFPFESMLEMNGWTVVKRRGDEVWVKRPGKTDKGHSAVLHLDGPVLNIFSTEAPAELLAIGKHSRDLVSVSAFDFLAATQFGGDRSAAARWIRNEKMSRADREVTAGTSHPPVEPKEALDMRVDPSVPILDDEFWDSRPELAHIRTAAWSRMVSPDATLLGVLARVSALTPPTLRLPAIVGSQATLDFIGCVAARSSGGKSISNDLAADLLPSTRKDLLLDVPIGSGEGLVQSFLVPELDDDGKPTGRQIVGMDAVHFTVDEGTALMEQHSRRGTTIVQTLCSAWSGRALGQANASVETRRIIEPRRVRVAAIINIQTANGHLLLDDRMVAIGFPQRLVFAHAEDPSLPEQLPEWPGPLDWRPPAKVTGGSLMTLDDEIITEVQAHRRAVVTGATEVGPLDGHLTLCKLKAAALLAILSGRTHVTIDDYLHSARILESSTETRSHLVQVKIRNDRDIRHRRAVASVEESEVAQEHLRQKRIMQSYDAIGRALAAHGPLTKKKLKQHINSRFRSADVLGTALQAMVDAGKITLQDGEYALVE